MIAAYRKAVADRTCLRRCFFVAGIVGTLLTLINQFDTLIAGDLSVLLATKVVLNYVVPFCVCTTGFATAMNDRAAAGPPA